MDTGTFGRTGRILRVDLTSGEVRVEYPEEALYRRYVGGSALGLFYLLNETPRGVDSLGPANPLILTTGPVAGAPLPGNSRLCATARSPLTGLAGDSEVGGYFAPALKAAGYDGLIVTGTADHPVYLSIDDDRVQVRDARRVWGLPTAEAEEAIREELGREGYQILEIGPAGERLARIASIMHMATRACGRNGLGAVMGSKRLKAIAVHGTGKPVFADQDTLKRLARLGAQQVKDDPVMRDLYQNGSNGGLEPTDAAGGLPTRNYSQGRLSGVERLSGPTTTATVLKGRETCFACPVRCKRVIEISAGPYRVEARYGGAEYESVAALGAYCGVSDLAAVQMANQYCNAYGLDTISAGATVAFAMECFENGLLTRDQTGGLRLAFGDAEAMVETIRLMGLRKGFGDLLADGSSRAATAIGAQAARYLTTVKGQELPAHMPQLKKSLALIYAVNPFGADHESSEHDPSYEKGAGPVYLRRLEQLGLDDPPEPSTFGVEKVRLAVRTQRYFALLDSVPLCHFCFAPWAMYDPSQVVEAVNAATGWNTSLFDLMQVGERRINLMRAFNAREGATRSDDTLPEKCFARLGGEGPLAGQAIDRKEWRAALDLYYRMCGWAPKTGNPSAAKCHELGLGWLLDIH